MVSATFSADFTSFYAAVQKADVKLRALDSSAKFASTGLSRMTDQFSGRKLIEQATLASEAIDRMGGTSRLTQGELQRAGNIAKEAADKMKALGVEVPPHIAKLAAEAERAGSKFNLMDSAIGKLGATVAATFTAGAVVSAIEGTGEWAGKIDDLSRKFDISRAAVQRWDFAAKQNGTSMDTVGAAMTKLSKNLVEGSDDSRQAIERLGLSFSTLRTSTPDDALQAVGEALNDLPSQTEKLATAQELLGRSGADLLPMFENLQRDMGRAVVVSDDLIQAGDTLGDSWDALQASGRAVMVATLSPLSALFEQVAEKTGRYAQTILDLEEAYRRVQQSSKGFFDGLISQSIRMQEELSKIEIERIAPKNPLKVAIDTSTIGPTTAEIRKLDHQTDELSKRLEKQLNPALLATSDRMKELAFGAAKQLDVVPAAIASGFASAEDELVAWNQIVEKQPLDLKKWENALYGLPPAIHSIGVEVDAVVAKKGKLGSFFDGFSGGLKKLWEGMSGGGGIGGLFQNIGGGISQGFGQIISGALTGGISTAINAGISLLGKGLGKLFGGLFGGEGKKTNDLRDQVFAAAGGFDELNKKAAKAGLTLQSVLNPKTVKGFQSAWEDLQKKLGDFDADQERLQNAIEKYGFSLEELGPQLQKSKLDDQAKELVEDWRVLVGAGVDIAAVNERMADSINEYLKSALSVGSEVPAAMRPVLEQLAKAGKLTDENGNKIEDLSDANIKWSETMTEGFDRVVQKLDELIKKLGQAGDALGSLPDSIPDLDRPFSDPAIHMARGGFGRVTRPTLFLAGEAGAEDVAFSGGGKSFGGAIVAAINRQTQMLMAHQELALIRMRDSMLLGRA